MKRNGCSEPAVTKEVKRVFGAQIETVQIPMKHEAAVEAYIARIEEAREKVSGSKLKYG